jgi:hypothetical protein
VSLEVDQRGSDRRLTVETIILYDEEARLVTDQSIVGVGDPAPDMTLTDAGGEQTSLSSLWKEQPLVLLFVRHLG